MITIKQFNDYVETLDHHDWYYSYSDDHSVWRRGNETHKNIVGMTKSHPVYQEVYSAFSTYAFTSDKSSEDYKAMVAKLMIMREQLRQAA